MSSLPAVLRAIVCYLFVIANGVLPPVTATAAEYNFVSIEGLLEQEVGRLVIPQVFAKMGIKITITPLPGNRAQAAATSGKKDGEIMRIYSYGVNNPTVIRVPTPYYSLETNGFIKKGSSVVINTKDDLTRYEVAKVLGVKHTDNITKGVPANQLTDMGDTEKAMIAVMKGRADVALTNRTDGLLAIERAGFAEIIPIDTTLAVLNLYMYIHKSKADIIPRLEETLTTMKDSGELAEIIKKAEATTIKRFTP